MNLQERANLVLTFARVLYVNGQSTDETLEAAERLGHSLGLTASIIPRWGELQLRAQGEGDELAVVDVASPTGVDMDRVASAMTAIDEVDSGRLAPPAAVQAAGTIAHAPPAPTWLFTLAAAAGAAALAVLFGVQHLRAVAIIVASAMIGALVRRSIARFSTNTLLQPFCAALVAGLVGALAVRFNLSSSLRLVAVCPCLILIPGPHVLNGVMDLVAVRVQLGAARLIYAGLIIVAICAGLLLGLAALGVSLPVDPPGRSVPLWLDVVAAGVAAAAYSIFFSTPPRMLPWPALVGAGAHALRWVTLELGATVATGALVACLFVGVVLTPVARRYHMPFAAVGFASVVSMMPGIFLLRMASGLVQLTDSSNTTPHLLRATVSDGMTAALVILAMSVGVIVPKLALERLGSRAAAARVRTTRPGAIPSVAAHERE
jgi:uncharacterized membrane protein YjjP (DUF1212 family)